MKKVYENALNYGLKNDQDILDGINARKYRITFDKIKSRFGIIDDEKHFSLDWEPTPEQWENPELITDSREVRFLLLLFDNGPVKNESDLIIY